MWNYFTRKSFTIVSFLRHHLSHRGKYTGMFKYKRIGDWGFQPRAYVTGYVIWEVTIPWYHGDWLYPITVSILVNVTLQPSDRMYIHGRSKGLEKGVVANTCTENKIHMPIYTLPLGLPMWNHNKCCIFNIYIIISHIWRPLLAYVPKDLLYQSTTHPRLTDLLRPKSTTLPLCLLTTDSVQWAHRSSPPPPPPHSKDSSPTSFPPAHPTVHMALVGYLIVFSFVTKCGQTIEFLLWGTIVPLNFLVGYHCSIVASTPQPMAYAFTLTH